MGYDVVVITDHFYPGFIEWAKEEGKDLKEEFLSGYRAAKEEGDKLGVKVLYGCELRFECSSNDYLVYGVDEDFFTEDKVYMTPRTFSEYAKEHGLLFYQAHPFRVGMTITRPEYLFGVEVHNGSPFHNSHNAIAKAWAVENGLHMISGSDTHRDNDYARGGVITDRKIETMDDLLSMLRDDDYYLITK